MHQHLWIRVCAVCARFGQENGASEGETLEQPTKDHPEEITKTLHGRFASIHISSNLLAKTLLTKCR